MPDDVAMDKVLVLEKLGAKVERVRPGQSIPENMDNVKHADDPASIIDEKQVRLSRASLSHALIRFLLFYSLS
jgi:hypothetical protein